MDFMDLCYKLRHAETQSGDTRIVDAQLIWEIHRRGPLTFEQLSTTLGLTNGSVSRTVRRLGHVNRKGEPGLGLVEVSPDPEEGRRYLVSLSRAGQILLGD